MTPPGAADIRGTTSRRSTRLTPSDCGRAGGEDSASLGSSSAVTTSSTGCSGRRPQCSLGRVGCVVLVGEGGVGKTRLLAEAGDRGSATGPRRALAAAPRSSTPARSACSPRRCGHGFAATRRRCPMAPFDRGLAARASRVAGDRRRVELVGHQLHCSRSKASSVSCSGSPRRTAVRWSLLDDLHAADAESLEADALPRGGRDPTGVLLVAAMRPGETPLADELSSRCERDGRRRRLRPGAARTGARSRDLIGGAARRATARPRWSTTSSRAPTACRCSSRSCWKRICARARSSSPRASALARGTTGVPRTIRDMVDARLGLSLDRRARPSSRRRRSSATSNRI